MACTWRKTPKHYQVIFHNNIKFLNLASIAKGPN